MWADRKVFVFSLEANFVQLKCTHTFLCVLLHAEVADSQSKHGPLVQF